MIFGIGKATKVSLRLAIDRPVNPYYPGDTVHASIVLQAEEGGKGMKMRQVHAGLVHSERYQYKDEDSDGDVMSYWTTDEQYVTKEILLGEGTIEPGFSQTFNFSWQFPQEAPPPTDGKITQSRWLVKASVDRKLRGDVNEEIELPIIVPPPGQFVQPGEYGESSNPAEAHMQLWLPKLEWLEGETIQGKLRIQSHADFNVREIRAELMRLEAVPRDEGNSSVTLVTKEKLAEAMHFAAHQSHELPFALTIPQQSCPTANTQNSQVSWEVRAALSRGLQNGFTVRVEVFVYNGPAVG